VAPASTTADSPRDALAEAFVTASRALVGVAIRSIGAAPVDITVPQHRLLVLLAGSGGTAIRALADQLGVDPSNASRSCDRLQRLGLISRQRSSADGRSVEVTLTGAGRALLLTVREHRIEQVKRILADVSEAKVAAMIDALQTFSEAAHEVGDTGLLDQAP
jgi:DNA-binding MarR family transcriptional regulator